jgi:sugar O-acyltransferase (sialic acid O-acetyltransferase NeuD family)
VKDLVILGAGGFGRETLEIVEDVNMDCGRWNLLGFLDDDPELGRGELHGYPILGQSGWLLRHSSTAVVVAIGHPATRYHAVGRLIRMGHTEFATTIHPRAWVARRVAIGMGTIVHAGVNIATDVRIGNHVILNKGCTLGHDVELGDYVFIAPGALVGAARVGEGCYVGANSTAVNYRAIGEWSTVGAGCVVLKDVQPNTTVVGVPGRVIREREAGWHLEIQPRSDIT